MKTLTLTLSLFGLVLLFASQASLSDDDEHEGKLGSRTPGVAPVQSQLYAEECGGCHFAYQPGFLPARSWKSIMAGLDNHFDDNAELGAEEHQAIF